MKKKIFILIILLIFIVGCKKKSDAKYIKTLNNKDIDVLILLDKDSDKHYIKDTGFINGIDSKIVVKDFNDNIIDISSNTDIYSMRNINYLHRYYKVYTSPITIEISNTYYNKKNIKYNSRISIQIIEPINIVSKNNIKDMNIEAFYNKYIKDIIDKNLNNSISNTLNKEKDLDKISVAKVNEEFNKLSNKYLDKIGISINIETIEFINK